ncbi:unnamed protein product [Acanthoscelides obtectus]|uniref:Uncharacterized protein n=1 Tax=Acanthoscelides obtectus TaxID=200917 RepID=A0A9P0K8K8_ACAOB|nr:unnamed protein product [Acanthoscelides obtectus]CAK1631056.1 hypothetical protein AOBTE_LOCUS6731 [Acanthoscelides obtectus]
MKHIIFALIHVHDYKVVNKNILGAFNHVKAEMACSKLCLLLILAVFLLHTGDAANVSRENRKHNRNTRDVTLTSTEQLVNYILQQIEAVLTTLLEGLCNLISPLVGIAETFRKTAIESLIAVLKMFSQLMTALPQYSVPANILTQALTVTNGTIARANDLIKSNGCVLTTSAISILDTIINTIIKLF